MKVEDIKSPKDIKSLTVEELDVLCNEIRCFLIENISKTGGHLSSNLGIVELTVALHNIFNSPLDKIFFDVGHQSYVHKILTGRVGEFSTLRQTKGLSGFQKRDESIHDVWEAGHSSTALSGAVAMAVARDLNDESFDVLPVIGDAAMLGGPTLEALNHLSSLQNKVIIILNDNEMSIGKRVGNVRNFLTNIQTSTTYNHLKEDYKSILKKNKISNKIYTFSSKIKNNIKNSLMYNTFYDDFGIRYIGPIDGHDITELQRAMRFAKECKTSVIIHVMTEKGRGYKHAISDHKGKWHGTGPFDITTGNCVEVKNKDAISWSRLVSDEIEKHMLKDEDIIAITPAMIHGSCMENLFENFPLRCFDVGIAEQHALTFAAGLSLSNKKPFISIYSSFIQRGYDQINHDIARMELPCLISVDRSGIVGSDGPTHHGVFDIGIFYPIPNVILFAPKDFSEVVSFINFVYKNFDRPYIMRIPRGNTVRKKEVNVIKKIGTWTHNQLTNQIDIHIITYGQNVELIESACKTNNINANIINARFIKPIDKVMLDEISKDNKPILVYETDLKFGGLNNYISSYYHEQQKNVSLHTIAIEDHYSIQGSINDIYEFEKIDCQTVINKIKEITNG